MSVQMYSCICTYLCAVVFTLVQPVTHSPSLDFEDAPSWSVGRWCWRCKPSRKGRVPSAGHGAYWAYRGCVWLSKCLRFKLLGSMVHGLEFSILEFNIAWSLGILFEGSIPTDLRTSPPKPWTRRQQMLLCESQKL